MMNNDELDRAHQRALNRANSQQTRASQAPSGDQLTDWQGLKIVRNNWTAPAAAHQEMKFEPKE